MESGVYLLFRNRKLNEKVTQISLYFQCLATSGCEEPTIPRLSAEDIEIDEGNSTFVLEFYVYLNEPASKKVIVDYTTSGVSAIAGEDFQLAQGVLEIEKGETSGRISLTILGDVDPEGTESFWISFSNPQNVTIPEPYAQITLMNDDGSPPIDNTGYTSPGTYSGYSLVLGRRIDGTSLDLVIGIMKLVLGDGEITRANIIALEIKMRSLIKAICV